MTVEYAFEGCLAINLVKLQATIIKNSFIFNCIVENNLEI